MGDTVAGEPAWSPDGKHLLFEKARFSGDGRERLWTMHADGTHKRPIPVRSDRVLVHDAKYTPDGRTIVFVRCLPPIQEEICSIWRMRTDGSHRRALTGPSGGPPDFYPSVSPDGRRVAFTRFGAHGTVERTWVMRIDGSGAHPITPAYLRAYLPDWSPDGRRITFSSRFGPVGNTIYTMKPDGSEIARITPSKYPNNDYNSVYSPEGDRILFVSDRSYPDVCCNDLFTVDPSGGSEQMLDVGLPDAGIVNPDWGTAALVP
jgi:TolB protein